MLALAFRAAAWVGGAGREALSTDYAVSRQHVGLIFFHLIKTFISVGCTWHGVKHVAGTIHFCDPKRAKKHHQP